MMITYNLKPLFKKDLDSFSKSYLKLKLWVVTLLKMSIEKSWFDYHATRCCNLAIQYVLPELLPGPNLHFRFMKNSVHTSPLWSLPTSHPSFWQAVLGRPVPWQDFELVPLSLCPGTMKELLSLCPKKLHCPICQHSILIPLLIFELWNNACMMWTKDMVEYRLVENEIHTYLHVKKKLWSLSLIRVAIVEAHDENKNQTWICRLRGFKRDLEG